MGPGVSPASAGTTVSLTFPISGSTCINATPLINLTRPGPGNTITVALGAAAGG